MVAVTYTSQAHKEGRWWVVQNDQVPGAISQVTRLDQAAEAQREAIAFVEDISADSIEVLVRVSISPEIDREVQEASALREEAQEREQRASELRRGVARRLEADGYTIRDIGVVLGVSYQRVHQLTH
ncbi:transcriptional regulator [Cryobacterium zongtaii]|uniref:Transcriptional regulator n=1 Tax=Cryobacterium zongtaii TaxID=1259217 RepID=A0A2S3ZRA3_9MICO|nr:transcriptional regulator [Cryobacterium zongtaii]